MTEKAQEVDVQKPQTLFKEQKQTTTSHQSLPSIDCLEDALVEELQSSIEIHAPTSPNA